MQVHHLRHPLLLRPGAVPVDVDLRIPIQLLAEVVELLDAVVLHLVIPVVGAGERRLEDFRDVVHLLAGQQVLQIGVVAREVGTGEVLDLAGGLGPLDFHDSAPWALCIF